jgi:hypothetical protein
MGDYYISVKHFFQKMCLFKANEFKTK